MQAPAERFFPKNKKEPSHLLPVLASRAAIQPRAQLRVGLLQLLVLRLQIREVLLEIFDLLVLALPERPLRIAVLRATPLFSLLVRCVSLFTYADAVASRAYIPLSATSSCRPGWWSMA